MSSSSATSNTKSLIVRSLCSIVVTFFLLKLGGNLKLYGVPVLFYCDLIERTLGNDPTENDIVSRLEGIDDTFERLRQHREALRQQQMGKDSERGSSRDYFHEIGEVHERRVVATAFNAAHQENMKNYAITARHSQRTSNELTEEAEAGQLTRDRLDELNRLLSDGVKSSRALRQQVADSLDTAKIIQEKLLEREKFLNEIRTFFGKGPLWIIWEYVQWVFDLVLGIIIEQLLIFEAFILDDGVKPDSASRELD